ncbi:MAG: cation diffusion facilitator family transporter [Desulfuromusa sp.]|nr:cation diffusion facilitator family transporter [Desulfuromusa sp.]
MSAHHHHHHDANISGTRLVVTMLLNFAITIIEIIGGLLSGSLSLISDALHNFSDGIAIIISYVALRLSQKPTSNQYTFGLKRAQILAAIINSGVLLAVCIYLLREAVGKLIHPAPVDGGLMLIVASFGLVANLIGTWLLHRGAKNNLNIRSAYLHLLSDAVSSVAVIIGAVAIKLYNLTWIDPILSIIIAIYVGWESWKIIHTAIDVLMLKVPGTISLDELERSLEMLPGVHDAHHIHLWQVDDSDIHFEAHISVADDLLSSTEPIATQIEHLLHEDYGINHVTLQFETDSCLTGNHGKLSHQTA